MIVRYTFDISTHNPVYAVCHASTGQCILITTDICKAIRKVQNAK